MGSSGQHLLTWSLARVGCFCIPLAGRLSTLAVLRVVTFVLLGWKIPLGSTGPVVDIEIPPVLSIKWDNRDRKIESQRPAWRLALWHDTLGQWANTVDMLSTIGGRCLDSNLNHPKGLAKLDCWIMKVVGNPPWSQKQRKQNKSSLGPVITIQQFTAWLSHLYSLGQPFPPRHTPKKEQTNKKYIPAWNFYGWSESKHSQLDLH